MVERARSLSVAGLLAVFVGFTAAVVLLGGLVVAVFGWESVDLADYGSSAETLAQNVLVPDLFVTALLLALVAILGWWSLFREDRKVPAWFWVFPASLALVSLANTDWQNLSDQGTTYALTLAAAMLVVGFNEETMFRGVLLSGFREHGSEVYAWAWSTALFGLVHGANVFNGSPVSQVIPQILNAFMLGTLFYLAKRVSGSLVVPILVHALWDFSLFSHGGSGAEITAGGETGLATVASAAPVVVLVSFVIVLIVHNQWTLPETALAEAAWPRLW